MRSSTRRYSFGRIERSAGFEDLLRTRAFDQLLESSLMQIQGGLRLIEPRLHDAEALTQQHLARGDRVAFAHDDFHDGLVTFGGQLQPIALQRPENLALLSRAGGQRERGNEREGSSIHHPAVSLEFGSSP
jgi:hypothetical protein